MDPQLSGFALGLLFGAGEDRGNRHGRLRDRVVAYSPQAAALEQALPDPGVLEERLASLEQSSDYIGAKLSELGEVQIWMLQQLARPPRLTEPSPSGRRGHTSTNHAALTRRKIILQDEPVGHSIEYPPQPLAMVRADLS